MTSAAAFVEGGIQESCDDACSICLEEFCNSDPSTVTICRHEFHLQCVLEWCQRSSQCPMCWRPISLKDPTSQELFEAVEQERKWRVAPSRNAAIFHHNALGDFGLQQLRMAINDDDFEERILQHLAAAASMRRAHPIGRRERQRIQPFAHDPSEIPMDNPSIPVTSNGDEPLQQTPRLQTESSSTSESTITETNDQEIYSNDRRNVANSSPKDQDRAGSSEFHSFTDTLRSRLNSVSMRYKESISKGARGWKEMLFSRSSSMSELGSDSRKDVNPEIASVSRLMEYVEARENNRVVDTSLSNHLEDGSMAEASNHNRS